MPTSAADPARGYDRSVSTFGRGESDEVRRFAAWLREYSGLAGTPEPEGPPAAIGALLGAGTSTRRYKRDGVVLGYIPGMPHRCSQIPVNAAPPPISVAWTRGEVRSR